MKNSLKIIILATILLAIFLTWYMAETSDSYAEPAEALFAIDSDLVLIPGYMLNGKALYFFIKDKNSLGVSYVHKGFLGWKADMLTWGPMDTDLEAGLFGSSKEHGEYLVYGLFNNNGDYLVEINGEPAKKLNLRMLEDEIVNEYHLEDLFLWYYERDTPDEQLEVNLLDRNTNKIVDTIVH